MATVSLALRRRTHRYLHSNAATVSRLETRTHFDLRDEDAPFTPEPWHAVTPLRPDTAHVRALRFLDCIGEAVSAFVLIVVGIGLTGYASLIGGV